jgi:hypothetical protein
MRLLCVRVYVCVKEAASIHGAYNFVDNQAGVAHCQVQCATRAKYLQCLRGLPIHFFGDSLARNQHQSVHAVHSRLFSKKPRARKRGAPGLTPRSRSNRTLRQSYQTWTFQYNGSQQTSLSFTTNRKREPSRWPSAGGQSRWMDAVSPFLTLKYAAAAASVKGLLLERNWSVQKASSERWSDGSSRLIDKG